MTDASGHYTVLARRFRPQTFDEVVGQGRIGQALRNAIEADRVAHAYLFTGARGVGKTSTARIFAKALNCPHVQNAVPCNDCDTCRSITAGGDVDVMEIDGASNRGIDDIRSLRSNVHVKPMRSPYKVYIIDEVHMLTKEAFNALLKTLEEPPPHVKFVFCTTEPTRVPDTILSRCQRFDFGTIAAASIQERLGEIAAAEGVVVEEDALALVARRAAGSMRDSQSLFDQLLAFGGERITAADVHQLLGTASDERLMALVDAVIMQRRDTALSILDEALREGVQIGSFSDQLLNYLRDLLVIASGADDVALLSVSENHRSRLAEQASTWGLQTATAAMQVLVETKARMQRVNYDRALMELAVIRLSLLETLDHLGTVIASLHSGAAMPSSPPRASSSPPRMTSAPQRTAPPAQVSAVTPAPERPAAAEKRVDLDASKIDEFVTEVFTQLGDRVSGHLKKSSKIAIPGPNRLEFFFPQSYFLSRQYVERKEIHQQIQDVVSKVAGHPVEIVITGVSEEVAPSRPVPSAKKPSQSRRRSPDLTDDAFVAEAVAIFGGKVVDVREIHDAVVEE